MKAQDTHPINGKKSRRLAHAAVLPPRVAAALILLLSLLLGAIPVTADHGQGNNHGQGNGKGQGNGRGEGGEHGRGHNHGHHPNQGFNRRGNLLIADQFNNRVIEVDPAGDIVWSFGLGPTNTSAGSIVGCNDAERVGKLTLMAGSGLAPGVDAALPDGAVDNRVILVDEQGRIVWQYGQFQQTGSDFNLLNTPVQAVWLPSDHVLITDQGNNRIIEVTLRKEIVWQYPGSNTNASDQLNSPNSAELLANGHILIADENNNRAIEVTRDDEIVQTLTAGGTLEILGFASRLPNGNTLLTDSGHARVVEVNPSDVPVWQYFTDTDPLSFPAPLPSHAVRLKNGDTLISDQINNRVIRVNMNGDIVADYGLPLASGGTIGDNAGYDLHTTQKGINWPYDAKVIGDYTGLTPPSGFGEEEDGDD